ncbi:MAG: TonB family protein [Deltaproteobacteria bacterium]|nr:TonB family protein [Deltaproteobacteria bacterium]
MNFLKRNAVAIAISVLIHVGLAAAIAFGPVQAALTRKISFNVTSLKQKKIEKPDLMRHPPGHPQELPPPVKRPKARKKKKVVDLTRVKKPHKPKQEQAALKIHEDRNPSEPDKPPVRVVTGVTLSSVTTPGTSGGGWSVPLGNTTFGPSTPRDQRPKEVPKEAPRAAYQVDRMPKLLQQPKVDYPEDAKRLGVEGKVLLKLEIDEHGKVTKADIVKSLYPSLDRVALKNAGKMIFRPALAHGEPVPVRILYTFSFVLEDEW